MGTARDQNGKALKRPAAPAPRPADGPMGPVVRQRDRGVEPELRQPLAVLQLAELPGGVRELVALVTELHPHPERTWKWQHAAAYRAVFPLVVERGRATAAAKREASRQVVRPIGRA
jgi:hypothetical protein